jgi:hypothetical protein
MLALRAVVALAVLAPAAHARADEPNTGDCERPTGELSTWLRLGGGGVVPRGERAEGVVDAGLGYDFTLPASPDGDVRVGIWGGIDAPDFISLSPGGGLELFIAAVPSELDLFLYEGEGVLSIRAGAGYAFRGARQGEDGPFATATIAYGYRAPWNLWDRWRCASVEQGERRAPQRYMIGARFYVTGSVSFDRSERVWSLAGGIEFEPVGALRYLLGLS